MSRRGQKRSHARREDAVRPRVSYAQAGPAALALLFVVLVAWSWRKWGDVFVDFGHELYIPWQLSEGRVLYRDIAYFMGPLSQYFNALMFAVFGVSFTTLIVVNLVILAGITAAIYRLFSRALGASAGLLVAAVFLCVFAFGHYVRLGNYNYVTPYLHEQTHGVALALLLLVVLERAARRPSTPGTAAAGATLGLVFLTKAEAFVPALACAVVASVLLYRRYRPAPRRALTQAAVFVAAGAVPVLAAFALLATQMSGSEALHAVVGNWTYLFDHDLIAGDAFYSNALGLDNVSTQLRDILRAALAFGVFACGALLLERMVGPRGRGACLVAGVLVFIGLGLWTDPNTWARLAVALPLVCAAAAIVYLLLCWRDRESPEFPARFLLAVWSVFAFVSLGKMILKTRIDHYGFALAMPGGLLLVAIVAFVIPRLLRTRGWSGAAWQAAALAAVTVGTGWLLWVSNLHYRIKTLPVGSGGDLMYTIDPRLHAHGAYFAAALHALQEEMPPDSTLTVLPDGALMNYLLRRPNPTPYYLMTPWEMRAFGGEEAVFAGLAANAPEYFVLASLDMSEFGSTYFGFDPRYGERTRRWLEQNYDMVSGVGEEAGSPQPWLRIYRRRDGHIAMRLPEQ